jgi:hypothetical protein
MDVSTPTPKRKLLRFTASIALVLAVLTSVRGDALDATASRHEAVDATTTVVGATRDEAAMVEWALDLYLSKGLDVRPITVVFHPRDAGWEPCLGAVAYYRSQSRTVDMCNSTRPDHERRHWILHEFGHAHTFATMSSSERSSFTEASAASSWKDKDDLWLDRGQERAADVVAWGLNPSPSPIFWMQDLDCHHVGELFGTLTGRATNHSC